MDPLDDFVQDIGSPDFDPVILLLEAYDILLRKALLGFDLQKVDEILPLYKDALALYTRAKICIHRRQRRDRDDWYPSYHLDHPDPSENNNLQLLLLSAKNLRSSKNAIRDRLFKAGLTPHHIRTINQGRYWLPDTKLLQLA